MAKILNSLKSEIRLLTAVELFEMVNHEGAHEKMRKVATENGVEALVVFRNLTFDSSLFGGSVVLAVGPSCTIKSVEEAAQLHLGDAPSKFQYPVGWIPTADINNSLN